MPRRLAQVSTKPRRSPGPAILFVIAAAVASCGGQGHAPAVAAPSKPDLDADPLALLPASAVVIANIDARAMYASGSLGAPVAVIGDMLLPLGDDAGLQASRDIDRVLVGSYATGDVDIAAVISGRFDIGKIAAATKAKNGTAITKGTYAGFATYAIGPTIYAPLTAKTLVAGTREGVWRVLERVQQGKIERSMPPWVVDTLETKGAEMAAAADFASQPVAAAALGSTNLAWIKGIRVARVIGNFEAPGMNFAATLTYTDAQQAQTAAEGIRTIDRWIRLFSPILGGAGIQNLQVATAGTDVQCKFGVDDQSLRTLLALVPRLLPTPSP
jgi:hypothetical protein